MWPTILSVAVTRLTVTFAWPDVNRSGIEESTQFLLIVSQMGFESESILTNMFSSERFASQQFRNMGMNKFLNGDHNI